MRKRFFVLAASIIAIAACGKPNDVKTLHHEALVVAGHYDPQLDQLDKRVQSIFKRGTTIPANLPGIEEVGKRLTEARDSIVQLRGIVHKGPDGKSAVEKQADEILKEKKDNNESDRSLQADKIDKLGKLVADTEKTMKDGTTIIEDDLDAVESWISLYDQGINRPGGPMPAMPPAPEQTPPVPQGNPATAPTGNQPVPVAPTPAPAHP